MYDEVGGLCDTELKELALNYARILKDGHNLPKHKLIYILEALAKWLGPINPKIFATTSD